MSNQSVTSGSQWDDIRNVKLDGEPWFVLTDLCVKLGIKNIDQVVRRLNKDGIRLADVTDSLGRTQNARVIDKPNLISFLARSNKPEAFTLLDQLYQFVIASVQSPDTNHLLQELASTRQQAQMYLEIAEKALHVDGPDMENAYETGEIEALAGSVRQLMKEMRAILKEKKIDADQLLELARRMEKKMAVLEERAAKTDETMIETLSRVGDQEKALKEFYAQAQAMLPPARQIEGPKGAN